MKWGGMDRIEYAWILHICDKCEAKIWLEKYYKQDSRARYCLRCYTLKELANAAN